MTVNGLHFAHRILSRLSTQIFKLFKCLWSPFKLKHKNLMLSLVNKQIIVLYNRNKQLQVLAIGVIFRLKLFHTKQQNIKL